MVVRIPQATRENTSNALISHPNFDIRIYCAYIKIDLHSNRIGFILVLLEMDSNSIRLAH